LALVVFFLNLFFIFSKKKLKKKAGIFGRAAPHRKGSGGTKIKTAENPLDKVHCKKRFSIFPSPAGMSLTIDQTLPGLK
jgi:hypothetical protein